LALREKGLALKKRDLPIKTDLAQKILFRYQRYLSSQLSRARKRLDDFYAAASADPTNWYSAEKEELTVSPSVAEQRVARERLRQGLESQYGTTDLQSRLQQLQKLNK